MGRNFSEVMAMAAIIGMGDIGVDVETDTQIGLDGESGGESNFQDYTNEFPIETDSVWNDIVNPVDSLDLGDSVWENHVDINDPLGIHR